MSETIKSTGYLERILSRQLISALEGIIMDMGIAISEDDNQPVHNNHITLRSYMYDENNHIQIVLDTKQFQKEARQSLDMHRVPYDVDESRIVIKDICS